MKKEIKTQMVSPKTIKPDPANVRESYPRREYAALRESIRNYGVLDPIPVVPIDKPDKRHKWWAWDGIQRTKIARELGIEVPIAIHPFRPEKDRILMSLETNKRTEHSPIERGHAYQRLVKEGMEISEIAKELNATTKDVSQCLEFVEKLPDVGQRALHEGKISQTVARIIARQEDDQLRQDLAEFAAEKELKNQYVIMREIRHRTEPESSTTFIHVQVTREELEQLREISEEHGVAIGKMCYQAIADRYLPQNQNETEEATELA